MIGRVVFLPHPRLGTVKIEYHRALYGFLPWTVTANGEHFAGPGMYIDHPVLGTTRINGARCWRTLREARAAVRQVFVRGTL